MPNQICENKICFCPSGDFPCSTDFCENAVYPDEFKRMLNMAKEKEWAVPLNTAFTIDVWLRYWYSMQLHESKLKHPAPRTPCMGE